jgi:hypothetical protein
VLVTPDEAGQIGKTAGILCQPMGQIHDTVGLPCDPAFRMLCHLPHTISPDALLGIRDVYNRLFCGRWKPPNAHSCRIPVEIRSANTANPRHKRRKIWIYRP